MEKIRTIQELFDSIPRHLLEPFFPPMNEHLKDDPDWFYEVLDHEKLYTGTLNYSPKCIKNLVIHLRATGLEFDINALHKSIKAHKFKMPK